MIINFCGDTSFTGGFTDKILNGDEVITNEICKIFKDSKYSVVNFEGPSSDALNLRTDLEVVSPPATIPYLKKCGITHLGLANNHILDCGVKGLIDTISLSKTYGIGILGLKRTEKFSFEILTHNGVDVGIITVTQLFPSMNIKGVEQISTVNNDLKVFIQEKKNIVDWLILNIHGGEEYTVIPWPKKESFYLMCIESGVDIIVGHHSHTFQKIKKYPNNKLVFNSLGNFVFDIPIHRNKSFLHNSAIVTLSFSKIDYSFKVIPIEIDVLNFTVSKVNNEKFNDWTISPYGFTDWIKDCNRVVSERNIREVTIDTNRKSILIYKVLKIFNIVKNKEFRAIVFGAVLYKLKVFLRIKLN
jgi:poly-gamma-glutamate synthesis protein (capsule biosynthesis protein)